MQTSFPLRALTRSGATDGQFVKWDDTLGRFIPATIAATSPAGVGTELQYRNEAAFGPVSGSSWDSVTLSLKHSGVVSGFTGLITTAHATYPNGRVSIGHTSGEGEIRVYASNNAEIIRLAASGNSFVSGGYFGINVTPTSQLHVVSSAPTVVGQIIAGATSQSVALLRLNQGSGATGNFLSCTSNAGTEGDLCKILASGGIQSAAHVAATTGMYILNDATSTMLWFGTGADTGFCRTSAGLLQVNSGSAINSAGANARDLMLRTLKGASVSGLNVAGPTIYIAPSQSTGSGTPASVVIQGTVAGASSSTAQTLVDVVTVTNGMVGIGTVPQYILDVLASSPQLRMKAASTSYATFRFENNGGTCFVGLESSSGGSLFQGTTAYSAVFGRSDARSVHLATSDLVRLTCDSVGLVGINKSSSLGAQLHIVQSATTIPVLLCEGMTNSSVPLLKLNLGATPTGNAFAITSNGGAEGNIFKIDSVAFTATCGGNIYGNSFVAANGFQAPAGGNFYWNARSIVDSPENGVIRLINSASTDFNRLQFGGTTASFPAIKRSSATLAFRLADDSADCAISASQITLTTTSTPASAAATGTTGTIAWDSGFVYVCVATDTWKRAALSTW